jgi:hypothetical protein
VGNLPKALREFNAAYAKEKKEHPKFTRKQVIQIVKDHLKKR